MNMNHSDEQTLEAQLKEILGLLRPIPERDADSILAGREKFLMELNAMPEMSSISRLGWLINKLKSSQKKETARIRETQKFAFTTLIVLIVVVVTLFGSMSATAYASQSALPGDALYGVKTTMEQTRLSLARDAYSRAQLHLQFAQMRMDEIVELLQQGRFSDMENASSEFDSYIQNVMDALQTVLAVDPVRGAALSEQVTRTLLIYTHKLQDVLANAPEPIKPAVERILMASEMGAGEEIEVIGGVVSISGTALELDSVDTIIAIDEFTELKDLVNKGDTVKVHAIVAADGSLSAREIDLFDKDGFGDMDYNGNDNGDDDNWNDNSDNDDNGNENSDNEGGNDNGDDNGNGNLNGDDDNGNDNDNGNSNSDDDHNDGNDNSDDDDNNKNENGDDEEDALGTLINIQFFFTSMF